MKASIFLLLLFIVIIANISSCKKAEIDNQISNGIIYIKDSVLYADVSKNNTIISYNLCIDKDTISFNAFYHLCNICGTEYYLQVSPLNGYEIGVSTFIDTTWTHYPNQDFIYHYDTVLIPKTYQTGDTIKKNSLFSSQSIMITYCKKASAPETSYWSGISRDILIGNTYKYFIFRKNESNQTHYFWLKVKVLDYSRILFNSYKDCSKEDVIVIK
jgi:hypothetical protein